MNLVIIHGVVRFERYAAVRWRKRAVCVLKYYRLLLRLSYLFHFISFQAGQESE